ncbi:Ubiquinone biosynthesis O-methyltransferase [bioreactor metagenome]|uniref:Ubiquinone biosynthesis O-methyltransferase n=1 Tax=bioreactor metagenome TaxID=1076179 RepID=A0A645CX76_9ZZZZ|nr:class I SAM-dependent methyltransferase [Christensenella sp.]
MQEDIATVQAYYDQNAELEWQRLDEHPFEFLLTTHMMERYVKPGDRVLDIGGGPGRYAIHFAKRGCEVTLVDLSEENVRLAQAKAAEAGVCIRSHVANCLNLLDLGLGQFDHVLLMGPLYHLIDSEEQFQAVECALLHLRPGAKFYASFILTFAGILYDLKNAGNIVIDAVNPASRAIIDAVATGGDYRGKAFTRACFLHQRNILPFLEQFPLKKLHFFGQEGILAPNEPELLRREPEEIACWLEIAKKYLEVPELLAFSEHAMYIGEKI